MKLVMQILERKEGGDTLLLERVITGNEDEIKAILSAVESARDDKTDFVGDPHFALQIENISHSEKSAHLNAKRIEIQTLQRLLECLDYAKVHRETKPIVLIFDAKARLH